MKLFFQYLKIHIKSILIFIIFIAVFLIVFFLYGFPVESIIYPAALFFVISFIIILVGFIRFTKKINLLEELRYKITVDISGLPEPSGPAEALYTDLIRLLYDNNRLLELDRDAAFRDSVDYYTLWAHQIKTPIAAMRLLLQDNDETGDISEQLFKIEQYVNMVLHYLRSESISSDLVIKKYQLDDIVRQAVRKYAKLFIRKKLSLEYEELRCEIITDEKWAVFVVEQLLSNALKYTHNGRISIYMDNIRPSTLVIEDTGIGIQTEDIPRIFEKGFTGFNGRSDKKSTGIGLYLCRKIIKKLGHTISIESETGRGTKVMVGFDKIDYTLE